MQKHISIFFFAVLQLINNPVRSDLDSSLEKMTNLKLGRRQDPKRVVYAINCGDKKDYTSVDGFVYKADTQHFFGNTEVATYYNHPKVPSYGFKYTEETELHRTERWGHGALGYRIPVNEAGKYVQILKFSEVNWLSEGSRVMNIKIGDYSVKKGFDILTGGHTSEVNLYFPLEFTESKSLTFNGQEQKNAYKNDKIIVNFETVQDNPKVNGIVLYRGEQQDTDYYQLDKIHDLYDKKFKSIVESNMMRDQMMEEYTKKKRQKKKLRNDYEDFDEFEDYVVDLNSEQGNKRFGLKGYLFAILGLMVGFCLLNRRRGPKVTEPVQNEAPIEEIKTKADEKRSSPPKKQASPPKKVGRKKK